MDNKKTIANRVSKELCDGDVVNLGIGLPTLVASYIPENVKIILQSENGFLGLEKAPEINNPYIVNAGGQPAGISKQGCFFDSAASFVIIRGGHVNVTVLGALQVDESGSLANWMIPNKLVPGMGGAMDLVVGAKKVIVAMEHTAKGSHKILSKCTLPLTAEHQVDLIVTEMCVIQVTKNGLIVTEINPMYSKDDIINNTSAKLTFADTILQMEVVE